MFQASREAAAKSENWPPLFLISALSFSLSLSLSLSLCSNSNIWYEDSRGIWYTDGELIICTLTHKFHIHKKPRTRELYKSKRATNQFNRPTSFVCGSVLLLGVWRYYSAVFSAQHWSKRWSERQAKSAPFKYFRQRGRGFVRLKRTRNVSVIPSARMLFNHSKCYWKSETFLRHGFVFPTKRGQEKRQKWVEQMSKKWNMAAGSSVGPIES